VEEQLADKVDRSLFEGLLDIFNKFEELLLAKRTKSPKGKGSSVGDPSSPSSIKKTEGGAADAEEEDNLLGDDSEEGRLEEKAAMESLRNKLDEQDKKY